MRVAFSAASLTDLRKIAAESRRSFGAHVAMALERHILTAIERISRFPDSAPRVENRAGVRVVALVRYPYRIFYRIDADRLTILRIRHTARRPWP